MLVVHEEKISQQEEVQIRDEALINDVKELHSRIIQSVKKRLQS